jgi:hypothetical protein
MRANWHHVNAKSNMAALTGTRQTTLSISVTISSPRLAYFPAKLHRFAGGQVPAAFRSLTAR